jgi:hypothetical protein
MALPFLTGVLAMIASERPTACDIGELAAAQMVSSVDYSHHFLGDDSYGASLTTDGMYELAAACPLMKSRSKILAKLDVLLDVAMRDPNRDAYKVLHNASVKFGKNIGDKYGILGIRYLDRAIYKGAWNSTYTNETDLLIASRIVKQYILAWPIRLEDGTIAREISSCGKPPSYPDWPTTTTPNYIWGDDVFMGLTLATRMTRLVTKQKDELDWVLEQHALFAKHLQDPSDGLYAHGYDHEKDVRNCCKWGRANGWLMMSHHEILLALEDLGFDRASPPFAGALKRLEVHATAMYAHQSDDGRFRQLINESSTYLETSGSAMTVFATASALEHGWLSKEVYLAPLQKAWAALATNAVEPSGNISGVCTGTCIAPTVAYYEARYAVSCNCCCCAIDSAL